MEDIFPSFKIAPVVRVIARQLSGKNCLAAIFASRHQDASPGPLGSRASSEDYPTIIHSQSATFRVVTVRFGHGLGVEGFDWFRFSVPGPLGRGVFSVFQYIPEQRRDGSGSGF